MQTCDVFSTKLHDTLAYTDGKNKMIWFRPSVGETRPCTSVQHGATETVSTYLNAFVFFCRCRQCTPVQKIGQKRMQCDRTLRHIHVKSHAPRLWRWRRHVHHQVAIADCRAERLGRVAATWCWCLASPRAGAAPVTLQAFPRRKVR